MIRGQNSKEEESSNSRGVLQEKFAPVGLLPKPYHSHASVADNSRKSLQQSQVFSWDITLDMSSTRSASPSEGEIVESGSEKASKSLPSVHDTSVDRTSRKRTSISRSPSLSHSPPPRRRAYRSRSRSPYRESRRSKRRRNDDHYADRRERDDPRSLRVHYDERRYQGSSNPRNSYRDSDDGPSSGVKMRHDDRSYASRPREKRTRTMSRSPPPPRVRDRKWANEDSEHDKRDVRPISDRSRNEVGYQNRGGSRSKNQSVSEKGPSSTAAAASRSDAEPKKTQARSGVSFELGSRNDLDKYVRAERMKTHAYFSTLSSSKEAVSNTSTNEASMDSGPLDEAALIEQRRKRREAIKAKHRGQGTPLLVQALNASNVTTPGESRPETPGSASRAIGESYLTSTFC